MRIRRRIKNAILKTITFIAAILYTICALSMESDTNIMLYFVVGSISGTWLLLFTIANQKES